MYQKYKKYGQNKLSTSSKIFIGHRLRKKRRRRFNKGLFLKEKSDRMSKQPTAAEMELATKLDKLGCYYETQRIVRYKGLDFIYDFHLKKPRKVFIEVDGGYHQTEEQQQTDRIKDFVCKKCLCQDIVRFTNEEVLKLEIKEIAKRLRIESNYSS